jgi:hypothetical protein
MLTYAHVYSRMLTYAHVCSRMLAYAHVCSCMLCSGDEDYLVIKHTGRYTFTDTLLFDIAEANAEVHDNLLRVLLVQKCKY